MSKDAMIDTPLIETCLPEFMGFIDSMHQDYSAGRLGSDEAIARRVLAQFTPEFMAQVDAKLPGWSTMSEYANNQTLVHTITAFLALFYCPEYQVISQEEQEMLKWVILLHDIGKQPQTGVRDSMHAFRSAVIAAQILPGMGFPITDHYPKLIKIWGAITNKASRLENDAMIPDNRKIDAILGGIDAMFGPATAAAYILKTILLHISFDTTPEWPNPATLSESQQRQLIDLQLFRLERVMLLADSTAWNLFDYATDERYRGEILASMEKTLRIIA